MANLRFEAVAKRFGSTSVLEGFDLEIADGEFLVVVGPSGCGKSTLLRLLAGLEEPSAGKIWIGDQEVQDLAPKARDVAMVFQSYALYPHMTVRRNIAFGLEMRGLPKAAIAEQVLAAARQLGLEDLLDRRPAELSGGQRQRVAVGRAIVRQPKVFLFDEPLSNLDAALRVQMRAELTALQKRLGTTTLYVTHDQVEAMTMGDRVAVMEGGKLLQCATPRELYERPANLFVARFLGTPAMNLLSASLGSDGRSLDIGGQHLPLPSPFSEIALGPAGRPLLFGLRPEAVHTPDDTQTSRPTLRAEVEFIEELGHESLVHARLAANRLTARCAPRQVPKLGAQVDFTLDLRAAHLFDPTTSRRIETAAA